MLVLCICHATAIVFSMGGLKEIGSPWPLSIHDHPIFVHTTWISPDLVRLSSTDAGYDPYFMAGSAKSVVFPQAAAYFELFGVTGRALNLDPARCHKVAVLVGTVLPPILIVFAAILWQFTGVATMGSLVLFLLYVWTNGGGAGFPLNYAWYGMVPYLLAVPLGLAGIASLTNWIERGGAFRWMATAILLSLTWLVHITTPMLVGPAGLAAYISAIRVKPVPLNWKRHLAFWALPCVIAVLNAWWWLPGVMLVSTSGNSVIAFFHPEPVWGRILEIVTTAPLIQAFLVALLGPGLWLLHGRDRNAGWGLLGFAFAGFGWGYLAGGFRQLDFLQPGRHTYGFFAAAALAGGMVGGTFAERIPGRSRGIGVLCGLGVLLVGVRLFASPVVDQVKGRLGLAGGQPFLSSKPNARFLWILDQLRANLRPGERLLYEESGEDLPGIPDPYQGHRYSGLLPWMTGVELIGGPYLRSALTTNHVQFGEGKLLGQADWGPEQFLAACKAYGPAGIVCWSPHAVRFCREHPELVRIIAEHEEQVRTFDPRTNRIGTVSSPLLFARILVNPGPVLRGKAEVKTSPGVIQVNEAQADELDGLVVLRYHLLPRVRSTPPIPIKPVELPGDPVPFIGFEPVSGPVRFTLDPTP